MAPGGPDPGWARISGHGDGPEMSFGSVYKFCRDHGAKKNRQVKSQTTSLFNPQRHKWDWDQKKYLNRHLNEWRSKPEKPSEKEKRYV